MYIQPNGRKTSAKRSGKASGMILIGFGALIFLYVIEQYTQRVMPSVRMAEAASAYFGFRGGHASLVSASAVEEQEIQTIVLAQANALKRKDFTAALHCTSIADTDIDAERYENILSAWYPQNAAPRSVAFSDQAMIYHSMVAFQRVTVTGQDGITAQELYMMLRTDDGWRIRRFRVTGYVGSSEPPLNP